MLGNEKITKQLCHQIAEGSLSHATLILGEKGMGKKTLAKMIGQEVFCRNKQGQRACLVCPECKKVISGNHPDVIWVTHEKPQVISVDDIRTQVTQQALIRPFEGSRKIIVIDEAEKMNVQAQNALLKTLEEPPGYLMILLLCSDMQALLDTIRSRCMLVKLQKVDTETIREHLIHELKAEEEQAEWTAAFACGNPGRALALAQTEEFRELCHKTVELCKNIRTMDAAAVNAEAKRICEEDPELTLELMEDWIRDVASFQASRDDRQLMFRSERSAIARQADAMSMEAVSELLRKLLLARRRLGANVNKELTLNLLLLEMRELS